MIARVLAVFAALCLVLPPAATRAAPSAIVVHDAWSRPAIDTGVVYATIENRGATADELIGASTPVARTVEVHQSMAGMGSMSGTMSMERIPALTIPSHGRVKLSPGGYHLMLIGLRGDLHAGQTFPLSLHFRVSGDRKTLVRVRPV